jgi:hypothetical protein
MALKGNLRDFSTTQLFNLIHLARKTGCLRMRSEAAEACIYFQEGRLVHAEMSGRDGRLSSVLSKAGKLGPGARNVPPSTTDKELALLLISAGYVGQKEILRSVRDSIRDLAFGVFTWSDGFFHFEPDERPSDGVITVPIDLENIILEGSRRVKEWELLQDELPHLDMALQFTDRPRAELRNISLTVEEWRVISYINPKNTIRRVAQRIGMDDFQIRKVVYGLIQAGLVEVVEPEGMVRPQVPAPSPGMQRMVGRPPAVKRSVIRRLIDRIRRL